MPCPNCGGDMIGDGNSVVIHCENAEEEQYYDHEPDAAPVYCVVPLPVPSPPPEANIYYSPSQLPASMPAGEVYIYHQREQMFGVEDSIQIWNVEIAHDRCVCACYRVEDALKIAQMYAKE